MVVAALLAGMLLTVAETQAPRPADTELLVQAETAFQAGMQKGSKSDAARSLFGKAAHGYEELRQRGAHNADLYRDQGNAYVLAGDLPQAILSYQRGLQLAPGDRILQANLTYAREQVAYPGPGKLGRPAAESPFAWLPYWSPWLRLLVSCCLYSLGWFSITRWWMVRRTAPLALGITTFGLAVLLAASLAMDEWKARYESLHPLAVIAADGVPLRKGNGVLYPAPFETALYRGVEARLRLERGDWLQIELAGGEVGWVPRAAVLLDTP